MPAATSPVAGDSPSSEGGGSAQLDLGARQRSMSRSACSSPKTSGGRIFKVARSRPVRPISTPRSRMPSTIRRARSGSGRPVAGSTMSTSDRESPAPYVAHLRVARRRHRASAVSSRAPDGGHPGDELLLLDGAQHRDRRRARGGAAAEGAEVVGVRDERVHQLRGAARRRRPGSRCPSACPASPGRRARPRRRSSTGPPRCGRGPACTSSATYRPPAACTAAAAAAVQS